MLARINSVREEPGGAGRLFVNDLNGPLYIVDKATRRVTTYLDFNGREGHHGLFHKLAYETGYANGLNMFQFDPDYRSNGKFYTVHIEDPALAASAVPDNAAYPGLNVSGYAVTEPITTPGAIQRECVLVEWTDSNTSNATFEGTARELMRIQLNTRIHTLSDIVFNPAARRGDSDWRVMYLGSAVARSEVHHPPVAVAAPGHTPRQSPANRSGSLGAPPDEFWQRSEEHTPE